LPPQPSSSGGGSAAGSADHGRSALPALAARIVRRLRETARLMVGIPDYDAYVEHRKAIHPGKPVMSYEEFFRERQDSRYGGKNGRIGRCC
jgi:uncharacterized short protein YbdD (DUF466 family)